MPLGDIAQLVEHLLCKQGVTGSNPVVSIIPGPRQRMCSRSECKGIIPRRALESSAEGGLRFDPKETGRLPANRNARKGHEIVAVLFSEGTSPSTPVAVMVTNLFFVRVNQVLVRLWARVMEAAWCAVFVPLSG
jgi:hypothetical protein